MRTLCPHCGVEESRCPEKLYACRARGEARRTLYGVVNGSELESLRAENEALRAENELLRMQPARGAVRVRLVENGYRPWPVRPLP